jgi:hypothetical protein
MHCCKYCKDSALPQIAALAVKVVVDIFDQVQGLPLDIIVVLHRRHMYREKEKKPQVSMDKSSKKRVNYQLTAPFLDDKPSLCTKLICPAGL